MTDATKQEKPPPALVGLITLAMIGSCAYILTRDPAPQVEATMQDQCDPYPSDIEALVVESIMEDVLVHDAALSQSDCGLSLVLMVNAAITEASAHERGERFVRQVKGLGPKGAQDEPLGAEIGRGQYDYTIGVYASGTREPIARGAKIAMARRIRW